MTRKGYTISQKRMTVIQKKKPDPWTGDAFASRKFDKAILAEEGIA